MNSKQKDGLKFQKRAARKLDGRYLGKHFMGEEIGDICIGDLFHVESKLVDKMPKYMDDVLKQSFLDSLRGTRIDGDTIGKQARWPIGIIQERERSWDQNVVIMKAGAFKEILKELRDDKQE